MQAIYSARRRAKDRGLECDLDDGHAKELWRRCKGRCELTSIPFDLEKIEGCFRRPFAPSIDRVNAAGGYTASNVRVVCTAVNLAMNQWGEDVLFRLARGLALKQQKWLDAGKRWRDHSEELPIGVKLAYMTRKGPRFSGSKRVDGVRVYTSIYPTVEQVLQELATIGVPEKSLDQ